MKKFTYAQALAPATQAAPIKGRESEMVKNSNGCYTFRLDPWKLLDRFLILGSDKSTYYASAQKLTQANFGNLESLLAQDGERVVNRTVAVSAAGLAPKNDQALFVLALASRHADPHVKAAALNALSLVARTGTHLFTFMEYRKAAGGSNRSLRNALGHWYNGKDADKLAYQLIKYRQRNGWSHRDVLRLAKPVPVDAAHDSIYAFASGKPVKEVVPVLIEAFLEIQEAGCTVKRTCELILAHRLPHEAVPTDMLKEKDVWAALLENMPMEAMVRNLGRMTSIGLISQMSDAAAKVKAHLTDPNHIQKSRIHPIKLLVALKTYAMGHGDKGSLTWNVVQGVVDSLDDAFYLSFGNVEPTNKRLLLALDISGSMSGPAIAGCNLTPKEATAAVALVVAKTEKQYAIVGFDHRLVDIPISPKMRLDDVLRAMPHWGGGSTDCALPFRAAQASGLPVDGVICMTDNETNHGRSGHPSEALKEYRKKMGLDAKLVVFGMTANNFSIADPADGGMLDVVGLDAGAPQFALDFISDRLVGKEQI